MALLGALVVPLVVRFRLCCERFLSSHAVGPDCSDECRKDASCGFSQYSS